MEDLVNYLQSWWEEPFNPNGSVITWALFVLLIIVLIFIWSTVIGLIKPTAKAVAEAV